MAGGQERILRGRIRTVQATKKITRAMELIAASRIVKAQQRVAAAVPYSEQITEVVKGLAAAGGSTASPLLVGRPTIDNVAYVVITADRGLCGGYNAGVQRAAEGCDQSRGSPRPRLFGDRRRAQGRELLQVPRIPDRIDVRRVQRHTELRQRQGDRRPRDRSVRQWRGRSRRARLHPIHLRRLARGRAASIGAARARDRRLAAIAADLRLLRPTSSTSPIPRPFSMRCCRSTSRLASTRHC